MKKCCVKTLKCIRRNTNRSTLDDTRAQVHPPTWALSSCWIMMCLTAFCHSIFFRRRPGDRVAARHGGSHSFIVETWVVSAKVTMMTSADLTGRSGIGREVLEQSHICCDRDYNQDVLNNIKSLKIIIVTSLFC